MSNDSKAVTVELTEPEARRLAELREHFRMPESDDARALRLALDIVHRERVAPATAAVEAAIMGDAALADAGGLDVGGPVRPRRQERESAADAQRRFAADNAGTADRLDAGGMRILPPSTATRRDGMRRPPSESRRASTRPRPRAIRRSRNGCASEGPGNRGGGAMINRTRSRCRSAGRPMIGRAVSRGVLLAALAGPVAADECSDYRAAFVLHEAAAEAGMDYAEWLAEDTSRLFDERYRSEFDEAERRTFLALNDAARAVQRTIDHEATATAIHAIATARDAVGLARHLNVRADALSPASLAAARRAGEPSPGSVFLKLSTAFSDMRAAYHDALHFVCFERDFSREQQP